MARGKLLSQEYSLTVKKVYVSEELLNIFYSDREANSAGPAANCQTPNMQELLKITDTSNANVLSVEPSDPL